MTEEEEKAARQAKCPRCKAVVVEEASLLGAMFITYNLPAVTGSTVRLVVCGSCSIGLREYLHPEITQQYMYPEAVAELRKRWAAKGGNK